MDTRLTVQMLLLASLCSQATIALAENTSPNNGNLNNGLPDSVCAQDYVDIFSCDLQSGEKIFLCANDSTAKLQLRVINSKKEAFTFRDPQQLIENESGFGATVIKSTETNSPLILYIYIGRYQDDEYSAVQYPGKNPGICKKNSSKITVTKKSKNGNDINIWNLIPLDITASFDLTGDEAQQSREENEIWRSWPARKDDTQ